MNPKEQAFFDYINDEPNRSKTPEEQKLTAYRDELLAKLKAVSNLTTDDLSLLTDLLDDYVDGEVCAFLSMSANIPRD